MAVIVPATSVETIVLAAMEFARSVSGVAETLCDLPIPSSYERGRTVFADAVVGLRFSESSQLQGAVAEGACQAFAATLGRAAAHGIRWLAVRERPILA